MRIVSPTCVQEALRMYPVFGTARVTKREVLLGGKYRVPKGVSIILNVCQCEPSGLSFDFLFLPHVDCLTPDICIIIACSPSIYTGTGQGISPLCGHGKVARISFASSVYLQRT